MSRHGFDSLDQVDNIIAGATSTIGQADGALVHLQRVGKGRKTRFNMVVESQEGSVVTGMQGLSKQEVRNLARNYGWNSVP